MEPVEPWSVSQDSPNGYYLVDKFGWKQSMPIDRALPYSFVKVEQIVDGITHDPTNLRGPHCLMLSDVPNKKLIIAQNKCLDKVRSEANQSSALAVAWIQRGQAIGQIEDGLNTLLRVVRAVKRRDPRIVRAVINRHPDKKALVKTPAGLWLGYWFGIVPTVSDIHHATQVLSLPFPAQNISGSSGFDWTKTLGSGLGTYRSKSQVKSFVKVSAQVSAINQNLALLDRLGFTSPLGVGLELIPWSWAVNYIVNIQQLAHNFEPRFPGIQLDYMCYSHIHKWTGEYVYQGYDKEYIVKNKLSGVTFNRYTGWPKYEPVVTFYENLSMKRISYLAAGVVMGLKGLK